MKITPEILGYLLAAWYGFLIVLFLCCFFSCIILTFIFCQRLTVETQADCPNDFWKTESIPLPLFYLFTGTSFPDI